MTEQVRYKTQVAHLIALNKYTPALLSLCRTFHV